MSEIRGINIPIGAELRTFNRTLAQGAEKTNQFRESVKLTGRNIEQHMGAAENQYRKLSIQVGRANLHMKQQKQAYDNLRTSSNASNKQIQKAKEAYRLSRIEAQKLGNMLDAVSIKKKELKFQADKLKKSNNQLGQSFGKVTGFANKILGVFGTGLGLYGVLRLFKSAISTIKDFDDQFRSLAAITGAVGSELDVLSRKAITLGGASKYGATGVTEMMKNLAKMGFATREIDNMAASITKLATAAHEDLGSATETVAQLIRSFGLESKDTKGIVDTMASSFTQSALDLSKFRESMKYIAPIAKQANFTLEDTTAILSTLADRGISGSLAGTSMRNVINAISDSSSELSKRLGFSINNFDDFADGLTDLKNRGTDLSDVFSMMDRRASSAFSILVENADKLKGTRDGFAEAGGAAEKMARIQMQSLTYQSKMAGNAWDSLVLSLDKGDSALSKIIRGTLRGFSHITQDITRQLNLQSTQMQKDVNILSMYQSSLQNTNNSLEDKRKILRLIKDEYPEMFDKMDIEAEKWDIIDEKIAEALRKKRAYLDLEFKKEDIEEYQIEIDRLEEKLAGLPRELQMLLTLEGTPEFENHLRQLNEKVQAANTPRPYIGIDESVLNEKFNNMGFSYAEFKQAMEWKKTIKENTSLIEQETEALKTQAVASLDTIEALKALQKEVDKYVNKMSDKMKEIADEEIETGQLRSKAYHNAFNQIEADILEEIRLAELRADAYTEAAKEQTRATKKYEMEFGAKKEKVRVEGLKKSLLHLEEARDRGIAGGREELQQTEDLLRLQQKLRELEAKSRLDGIALEKELSKIKTEFRTKHLRFLEQKEAEYNLTVKINALEKQMEDRNIRLSEIKEENRLLEQQHKIEMDLLQSRMEKEIMSAYTAPDIGEDFGGAMERQLRQEIDMAQARYEIENNLAEKNLMEKLRIYDKEEEEKKLKYEEGHEDRKKIEEEYRMLREAAEEQYNNEKLDRERELGKNIIGIEGEIHNARMDLKDKEFELDSKEEEFKRRVDKDELERIDSLWEAIDLFGTKQEAIRQMERQHAVQRLEEQKEYLKAKQAELIAELEILKTKQQELLDAGQVDEAVGVGVNIETTEQALRTLGLTLQTIDHEINEALSPPDDQSDWDDFLTKMKGFGSQLVGIYQGILNERERMFKEERAMLDRSISETQRDIDIQLRLREQGFASDVQAYMQKLEAEKQARDVALRQEKKAAKEKRYLEMGIQAVNLITAATEIFKSEISTKGKLGIATAAAAVIGLYALYESNKSDAQSIATYEKGGSGMFKGKSHADGGIQFAPGHEAQGGEMWGILNRNASKKHGKEFKSVVDMYNDPNFNKTKVKSMGDLFKDGYYQNPDVVNNFDTTDIKAIRKQLEKETISYSDGYKIIQKGNRTIRIKCHSN